MLGSKAAFLMETMTTLLPGIIEIPHLPPQPGAILRSWHCLAPSGRKSLTQTWIYTNLEAFGPPTCTMEAVGLKIKGSGSDFKINKVVDFGENTNKILKVQY